MACRRHHRWLCSRGVLRMTDVPLALQHALVDAAQKMIQHYIELVDSGDCGKWGPHEVEEVKRLKQSVSNREAVLPEITFAARVLAELPATSGGSEGFENGDMYVFRDMDDEKVAAHKYADPRAVAEALHLLATGEKLGTPA